MKLVKLSDLFDIKYGVNLELNSLEFNAKGIPFVSRTSENNGVSAHVKPINEIFPNPANTISISGGGSVCEAFLQKLPYYSGRDLFYIVPKSKLTESEMLLYCSFIRANRYRYSYGRQANKTLANIKVPTLAEVRNLLPKFKVKKPSKKPYCYKKVFLSDRKWKWFKLSNYFSMLAGKYYYKEEIVFNKYISLFLITLINKENYRWNYGRQIRLNGCRKLKIKLPINDITGNPDWKFMEYYIKSLPYSCNLKNKKGIRP